MRKSIFEYRVAARAFRGPSLRSGSIVGNVAAGGSSSLFKLLIQILMLPVMARLLGPREFGLFATGLPLVSFFSVLADGGLGASLARDEPSSKVWSTAFYVMLIVAAVLVLLTNVAGYVMSETLHEPRLRSLMEVLSISFVCIGPSVLPFARLVRRNDLISVALLDVISAAVGAAVAVALARAGAGALSLAYQYVVAYGVRAIGLNLLAFERPRLEFSLRVLSAHIRAGGTLVGSRLLDLLCRYAENLLFSIAFGTLALGAYTFATQVSRFVCEAASNPIWSALYAQAVREPRHSLGPLLANTMRLMTTVTGPTTCLIAAAAPQLLQLGPGAKWLAAAPFLQWLAPSNACATTASLVGATFLAIGRNRSFLVTGATLSIGRVVAVALGCLIGTKGTCIAVAAVNFFYLAFMVHECHRLGIFRGIEVMRRFGAPILAGLVGGIGSSAFLAVLPLSFFATILSLAVGGAIFVLALIGIEGEQVRSDVKTILAAMRTGHPANEQSNPHGAEMTRAAIDSRINFVAPNASTTLTRV